MSDKIMISKIILTNFRQHSYLEVSLASLNVIVGENGAGKTSILEALCYGLFGTVANGATKKELLKIGEKSGGVTIVLSNNYKIVRDFSTTIKLLDDKDRVVSEKANEIESYLSIDRNIFLNILYAAQNDIYSYFIKFNAKEKDFMDNLFNLSDLTDIISGALKDASSIISNQYNIANTFKSTRDSLQKYIHDTLDTLKVSSIEQLREVMVSTASLVDRYKKAYQAYHENQSIMSTIESLRSNRNMIENHLSMVTKRMQENDGVIEGARASLDSYVSSVSSALNTPIDTNNLESLYSLLNTQCNITTHINNIITAATSGQQSSTNIPSILSYIIATANTILQIDQYRNYYNQIINDLRKLSNEVTNAINRKDYDSRDSIRLSEELNNLTIKLAEAESLLDKDVILDEDAPKISNVYIQQQSYYSTLESSYRSLITYKEQLDKLAPPSYSIEDMQLLLNEINGIIPVFSRDGFVSYLRKNLLKEIAVSIGDSLEKFGFTKLLPVDIDDKSGALLFHGRPFRSLSGGEKTIAAILLRVLYARLLAPSMKLSILMLDEPTADLDSIRVGYLRQMLSKISSIMGMQVLVVTHDEQVIPDLANLIVINSQIR